MRKSSELEALENGPDAKIADVPDPPPLDRPRLDTDPQVLFQQRSNPWIIFDRDTQADFAKSALRAGACFVSSPNFRPEVLKAAEETGRPLADVVEKPLPGLAPIATAPAVSAYAPPTAIVTPPSAPKFFESESPIPPEAFAPALEPSEPSTVVVASDISDDTSSNHTARGLAVAISMKPPAPRKPSRGFLASVASVGMFAAVLVGAIVVRTPSASPKAAASTAGDEATSAPVQAPIAPPADLAVAPVIELPADEPPVSSKKARYGRLTISSHAKHKNIYLDGKRMAGNGRRSFIVACGPHTVAVADKASVRDIEIPCEGEVVVGR